MKPYTLKSNHTVGTSYQPRHHHTSRLDVLLRTHQEVSGVTLQIGDMRLHLTPTQTYLLVNDLTDVAETAEELNELNKRKSTPDEENL